MPDINIKRILIFVFCILFCELAGILGSFFTTPAIPTWYATINKPAFTPPNWLFAPVWIALFALMGVALYLILTAEKSTAYRKHAIFFFMVQLILNIAWSALFFGMQNPFCAFLEIIALWLAIAITMCLFWRVHKKATLLLSPYILWVSFAAILNFSVWRLNL